MRKMMAPLGLLTISVCLLAVCSGTSLNDKLANAVAAIESGDVVLQGMINDTTTEQSGGVYIGEVKLRYTAPKCQYIVKWIKGEKSRDLGDEVVTTGDQIKPGSILRMTAFPYNGSQFWFAKISSKPTCFFEAKIHRPFIGQDMQVLESGLTRKAAMQAALKSIAQIMKAFIE